jgi:predicted Rossmann fold nucleotide-binding protein DprA/Smf involved in DNA uptake
MTGERVAVIGSRPPRRDAPEAEREAYERLLSAARAYVRSLPLPTVIVSGRARGIDTAAETVARERLMAEPIIHLPDYQRYDPRRAPLVRNELIARDCERMEVYWDGKSTGCLHAARLAARMGKPVMIHRLHPHDRRTLVTQPVAFVIPGASTRAYTGPALKKNSPEALARPEALANREN